MNKQNLLRRNRNGISRGQYSSSALLWILSLITVLFVLNSCKKDKHTPDVSPGEKELIIEFGAATIPVTAVDSGYVVFKRTGTGIQTLQRFDKDGSVYKVDMGSLSPGDWTAYISFYAGVPNTTQKREYFQTKTFTLKENTAAEIKLAAPTGANEETWKRRAHFHFGAGLNTFISMDPEDPYFRINVDDKAKWDYFSIVRIIFKKESFGKEFLAGAGWECYTDCFTSNTVFEDSTHFIPFNNEVKGKPWNYAEIELLAFDKDGKETNYFFPYNK